MTSPRRRGRTVRPSPGPTSPTTTVIDGGQSTKCPHSGGSQRKKTTPPGPGGVGTNVPTASPGHRTRACPQARVARARSPLPTRLSGSRRLKVHHRHRLAEPKDRGLRRRVLLASVSATCVDAARQRLLVGEEARRERGARSKGECGIGGAGLDGGPRLGARGSGRGG